jgi:phosphomevalonate kinase
MALAPGKLVLSGAYAVLDGAPAVVTAVNRYVLADASRPPTFVTPEVSAALDARGGGAAPWFDASALRDQGRKLGLGSSSAIVVASLAALELSASPHRSTQALQQAVFLPALRAHRAAQGGGSGIDVAAAVFGGTLLARRRGEALEVVPVSLPPGLHLEVWSAGTSASTAALLGCVARLAREDAALHRALLEPQADAALLAAAALRAGDLETLLDALSRQCESLAALGRAAGAPIVTAEVRELHAHARLGGGVVLPSGAGGGDVALYAGAAAPTASLRKAADASGYVPIEGLRVDARGMHSTEAAGDT